MAENNIYKTKQKELILNCLKSNIHRHMTAEEIYMNLATTGNKVGIATIYRNLTSLVEESKVKKFNMENTSCYQYMEQEEACKNHYHLKCVNCNKIYHIESPELDKVNKAIGESNDFFIDNQQVILYGRCKEC